MGTAGAKDRVIITLNGWFFKNEIWLISVTFRSVRMSSDKGSFLGHRETNKELVDVNQRIKTLI